MLICTYTYTPPSRSKSQTHTHIYKHTGTYRAILEVLFVLNPLTKHNATDKMGPTRVQVHDAVKPTSKNLVLVQLLPSCSRAHA